MAKRHDAAVYGTLYGDATLTAMLSGVRAIYAKLAPQGAVLPYIVFFEQAGGRVNEFNGDHDDVYYAIKCVADVDANGQAVAEAAAERIEMIFHRTAADPTLGDSWVLRASTVTGGIGFAETVNNKTYIHAGRIVRLRSDK